MAERERRAPPHLNVASNFLVYMWNVPVGLRGRELKEKLSQQIGPVRFVETFEAWNYRQSGHLIVEFGSLASVEFFVEMMAADRIPYLHKPVGFQDLITFGRRQFFELVYRDTGVDLLGCDGNPPSSEWNRQRPRGMAVRSALGGGGGGGGAFPRRAGKPYERERGRTGGAASSSSWRRRSESPSPVIDTSPFPSAATTNGTLRRFLWSTEAGRKHILTVDELNRGGTATTKTKMAGAFQDNKTQQKLCARVQEMDIEEGEIVEDDGEELEDGEIVVPADENDDDDYGVFSSAEGVGDGALAEVFEDGELVDDGPTAIPAERHSASGAGGKRRCASAIGCVFRQRSATTTDCGGDEAQPQQRHVFFRSPPPSQAAQIVSSSITNKRGSESSNNDKAFSRELQQRLHKLFGPPPVVSCCSSNLLVSSSSSCSTTVSQPQQQPPPPPLKPTGAVASDRRQRLQQQAAQRGRRQAAAGITVPSSCVLLHQKQQHKEKVFKRRALPHTVGTKNCHNNSTIVVANSWASIINRRQKQLPPLMSMTGVNSNNVNVLPQKKHKQYQHQHMDSLFNISGSSSGRATFGGGKSKWWRNVMSGAGRGGAKQSENWPRKRRRGGIDTLDNGHQNGGGEEVITLDSDSSSSSTSDNNARFAAGAIANLRISAATATAAAGGVLRSSSSCSSVDGTKSAGVEFAPPPTAPARIGCYQRRRSSGSSRTGSSSSSSAAPFPSSTTTNSSASFSSNTSLSNICFGTVSHGSSNNNHAVAAFRACDGDDDDGLKDVVLPPICNDEDEDDDDGELLESVGGDDDDNLDNVIEIDQSAPPTVHRHQPQQQNDASQMMEEDEELDWDWEFELVEHEGFKLQPTAASDLCSATLTMPSSCSVPAASSPQNQPATTMAMNSLSPSATSIAATSSSCHSATSMVASSPRGQPANAMTASSPNQLATSMTASSPNQLATSMAASSLNQLATTASCLSQPATAAVDAGDNGQQEDGESLRRRLQKEAEEREISRLLDGDEDGTTVVGGGCPVQQRLFDERILDDDEQIISNCGGDDDACGGGGERVEEMEDSDHNDGLNLSIRRLSCMSLNADDEQEEEEGEEEDEEESVAEYPVLEIRNLCHGFSLDAIHKLLQRSIGPVPFAKSVSSTHARFHCDCGAERAARFLYAELDAARRTLLLGPSPEFHASRE